MKELISRLTMKALCHRFDDIVSGKGVYLYIDKFGEQYLANYHFYFWSFRIKQQDK
jgi:hypothetical protein